MLPEYIQTIMFPDPFGRMGMWLQYGNVAGVGGQGTGDGKTTAALDDQYPIRPAGQVIAGKGVCPSRKLQIRVPLPFI